MAVFSTRNLLTSTLLVFANKGARSNLDTFHEQNNSSSFTRRTDFYGDKNFNLVVVFCGIILPVV